MADNGDRPSVHANVQADGVGTASSKGTGYTGETVDEKQAGAEDHGFDSWDDYVSFCEDADSGELLSRGLGIGTPDEQTVADELWLDHSMHGSFEFHGSDNDIEDGFF